MIHAFYAIPFLPILFTLYALNISSQQPSYRVLSRRQILQETTSVMLLHSLKWENGNILLDVSQMNLENCLKKKLRIVNYSFFSERAGNLALPLASSMEKWFTMFKDLKGHHKYSIKQYVREAAELIKALPSYNEIFFGHRNIYHKYFFASYECLCIDCTNIYTYP